MAEEMQPHGGRCGRNRRWRKSGVARETQFSVFNYISPPFCWRRVTEALFQTRDIVSAAAGLFDDPALSRGFMLHGASLQSTLVWRPRN